MCSALHSADVEEEFVAGEGLEPLSLFCSVDFSKRVKKAGCFVLEMREGTRAEPERLGHA